MEAIRITRNTRATNQSLAAGEVYPVPGVVSEADAAILIRIGKAEPAAMPALPTPKRTRRKRSDADGES